MLFGTRCLGQHLKNSGEDKMMHHVDKMTFYTRDVEYVRVIQFVKAHDSCSRKEIGMGGVWEFPKQDHHQNVSSSN